MKLFSSSLSRDPARIRSLLKQLCDEISARLGDNLESIALYGNFARYGELESDQDVANLLLILKKVDHESLDQIAGLIRGVEKKIPLGTMTLTREDLHSSCDVFPVKFHDMKLYHRILVGDDVFSDLHISDSHLRLRCEQQLKNLMIRMRADYLHRSQSQSTLLDCLLDANRHLISDMQACLVVKSGIAPEEEADLPASYGEAFQLDTSVVNEVLSIRKSGSIPSVDELKTKFGRLMQLVHDSAIAVDQLEVQA